MARHAGKAARAASTAAPKSTPGPKSLDEVDPELLKTYEKLGIPLREREILAIWNDLERGNA